MQSKANNSFRRILAMLGREKMRLLLALLLTLAYVWLTLLVPRLIGDATDCIKAAHSVDWAGLRAILFRIGLLIAAVLILQYLASQLFNCIAFGVEAKLREDCFRHLQALPLSYLDHQNSGEVISRLVTDIEQIGNGLLLGLSQIASGILTILFSIIFMIRLDLRVALVVFFLSPASILLARFIAMRTLRHFQSQSALRGDLSSYTEEILSNQRLVQCFGREDSSCAAFETKNEALTEVSLRATFYASLTNPSTRLLYALIYAGVAFFGAMSAGTLMTVGKLASFLAYTQQYSKPFYEITGVVTEFQNALASAERVFSYLDEREEEKEEISALDLEAASGEVVVRDLDFSYETGKPVLSDFSFEADAGKKIALVGPTGCGKTTLINLLMRFYEPDQGTIEIDGFDVKHLTKRSLRAQFAMVLQDVWLASGTIAENIAYGKADASEEEIRQAAKAAHADTFIEQLPEGYQSRIGETQVTLSHGQKQLICIARAMLNLPPILLLDEATSSVDARTEAKIQDALDLMMQGRTSIVVAHRLSTIQNADCILVMGGGHIIERGTHAELIKKGGAYAALYKAQFAS